MSCETYPAVPPATYPNPMSWWSPTCHKLVTAHASNPGGEDCEPWIAAQTSLVNALQASCPP